MSLKSSLSSLQGTFHQMRGEACDLVAQPLGRNGGHLLGDLLVDLEVQRELAVVLLHNHPGGLDFIIPLAQKMFQKKN